MFERSKLRSVRRVSACVNFDVHQQSLHNMNYVLNCIEQTKCTVSLMQQLQVVRPMKRIMNNFPNEFRTKMRKKNAKIKQLLTKHTNLQLRQYEKHVFTLAWVKFEWLILRLLHSTLPIHNQKNNKITDSGNGNDDGDGDDDDECDGCRRRSVV